MPELKLITECTTLVLSEVGIQGEKGDSGSGSSVASQVTITPIAGLPGVSTVQSAIAALAPVYQDFTDASLSIAGMLPVTHGLETLYPSIEVWDDTGQPLVPDSAISSGVNAIAVGLQSFRPLTGTWKIKVER